MLMTIIREPCISYVGIALVQENGVSQVFNHKEEGYTFEIMKATGGKGVDAIIEMLSNVNLNKDLEMVAKNGIIMVRFE